MSVSLRVDFVFGYHIPDGRLGLNEVDLDEHEGGVTIDPVECMNGREPGILVYATASNTKVLRGRDGYDFEQSVISVSKLPGTAEFAKILKEFLLNLPFPVRTLGEPDWHLHVDLG